MEGCARLYERWIGAVNSVEWRRYILLTLMFFLCSHFQNTCCLTRDIFVLVFWTQRQFVTIVNNESVGYCLTYAFVKSRDVHSNSMIWFSLLSLYNMIKRNIKLQKGCWRQRRDMYLRLTRQRVRLPTNIFTTAYFLNKSPNFHFPPRQMQAKVMFCKTQNNRFLC